MGLNKLNLNNNKLTSFISNLDTNNSSPVHIPISRIKRTTKGLAYVKGTKSINLGDLDPSKTLVFVHSSYEAGPIKNYYFSGSTLNIVTSTSGVYIVYSVVEFY